MGAIRLSSTQQLFDTKVMKEGYSFRYLYFMTNHGNRAKDSIQYV